MIQDNYKKFQDNLHYRGMTGFNIAHPYGCPKLAKITISFSLAFVALKYKFFKPQFDHFVSSARMYALLEQLTIKFQSNP